MYAVVIFLAILFAAIVFGLNRLADLSVFSVAFLIFLGFFAGLIVGFAFCVEVDEGDWEDSGF